jgi:hypothetical protein
MTPIDPDLRRTWLFGPGADARAHDAMQHSGADGLILDLEDLTQYCSFSQISPFVLSLSKHIQICRDFDKLRTSGS